uniref:Uncharacterized protein n=1 Tax=Knipowitschia caucasica TaxID=637954 RepID=A0AAV2JLN7_KNICA
MEAMTVSHREELITSKCRGPSPAPDPDYRRPDHQGPAGPSERSHRYRPIRTLRRKPFTVYAKTCVRRNKQMIQEEPTQTPTLHVPPMSVLPCD